MEQVVENEVAANGAGGIDTLNIAGEEMRNVAALENEQNNPSDKG